MNTPDIELARRFLAAHGPPDEVLHVGVTGAHIYGFTSADSDIGFHRPARLNPAAASIDVIDSSITHRPQRFRWRGREYVVARLTGPERIETGWWRDDHICRDYFRVETTSGEQFWLFRSDGKWFLHGLFD